MDEQIRLLERRAAQGDQDAAARLRHERVRVGLGIGEGAYMIDVLKSVGLEKADATSIVLGVRAVLRRAGVRGVRADVHWGRDQQDPTCVELRIARHLHDADRGAVADRVRDLLHRPERHVRVTVDRWLHRLHMDQREALPLSRAKTHVERAPGPWLAPEQQAVFLRRVARAEARRRGR